MVERKRAKNGILILGGGFAGSWVAHHLGKRGATVVSPDNFTLYTPMLPEAASGTLEPRHVVVPLRMMCKHSELVLGSAVRVDLTSREVEIESMVGRICITYERLVLAPGAVTRALPIPGLGEHAMPFKNLADAIHLRNHVLRRLEAAAEETDVAVCKEHLTFVFIGAGYAGVEALAELSDLVKDARRFYPSLADVQERWVLVDAAPKILPEIPRRLGEYAAKELAARGVDVRTKTTLNAVENGVAVLSDDTRIAARTMVGMSLEQQGIRVEPWPTHVSVKESVFPFTKFPGVDTILGPEMRSTGEVMGIAETFARAFGKSMLASGLDIAGPGGPKKKKVFISVKDEDKPVAALIARRLRAMGYEIMATRGTAASLSRARVPCEPINKVNEGPPHVVDAIKSGMVAIVINTTLGAREVRDSYSLRRQTLLENIPYFTTIAASLAACDALEASESGVRVKSLQEWNKA